MPAKTFFDHIAFFAPTGRILVGLGVAGALTSLLLRREDILTWAAVSLGLGLAMIFFREAFRPKLRPQGGPKAAEVTAPHRWIQWMASATIITATALGFFFKGALLYVTVAVVVFSVLVALVLGVLARRNA